MDSTLEHSHIVTPKDKKVHKQTLNAKKKRIFRILKSGSSSGNNDEFSSIADETMTNNIFQMFTKIVKNKVESLREADKSDSSPKTLNNVSKKSANKVLKFDHSLLFGFKEVTRSIRSGQTELILVDSSLALNMKIILREMASSNRVACLEIGQMDGLAKLFRLTTLSMMAFKVPFFEI